MKKKQRVAYWNGYREGLKDATGAGPRGPLGPAGPMGETGGLSEQIKKELIGVRATIPMATTVDDVKTELVRVVTILAQRS